jgi:hypothetical protein
LTFDEDSENEDEAADELDPVNAERYWRAKKQDHLRRTAGEPTKPDISEVTKLQPSFLAMLRMVLAD